MPRLRSPPARPAWSRPTTSSPPARAGVDRVTAFSLAQGDRVQLDPGTQFTVSEAGADTVINMTGGGQMILVGAPGWIFGA